MIHTCFAIISLFFHKVCYFQYAFVSVEEDAVNQCCKIPCLDFGTHHENFVSVCCHLENAIHLVHPLQGQAGGSRKVPYLCCEEDGEEQYILFFAVASCAQAGVRPVIVMKEKDVFRVLVRTNSTDVLLQFV
jgi:hypothetical protein